ncbi:MAG TPA: YppG family protein [Bacillus sp. (in: firmicutes)]|nr:YppG family protein [Bacillus sp. (in: firmicutes)]
MNSAPYYATQPQRMDYPYAYPFASYQPSAPMHPYWPMYGEHVPQMGMSGNMNMMSQLPNMTYMGPRPPMPHMYPTPYPAPSQKAQPKQMQSIMSQFKTSDGNLDINKMMNTAGQMMNAVNQLSGMVKGLSGVFKV